LHDPVLWRRGRARRNGHSRWRSRFAAFPSTRTTASRTPSRRVGQRLDFDLTLDVPDCDAVLTDRVDDTVDYSEVCDIVALAATERSFRTLERLCQVVAERLMERFDCESVQVRAAKPEPPLPYPVQEAGVEVTLERSLDRETDDEEEGV
jgi:dihydroneopterin aldolase